MKNAEEIRDFINQVRAVQVSLLKKQVTAFNNGPAQSLSITDVNIAVDRIEEIITELFYEVYCEALDRKEAEAA